MSAFYNRHIGIQPTEKKEMLEKLGLKDFNDLTSKVLPKNIIISESNQELPALTENQFLCHIKDLASNIKLFKTYIGCGWYDTYTPAVIQRNIFENPSWYTSYTPYQAEISQGRLEALLNFQTMIIELTGLPLTNASMLDESTVAAEVANMFFLSRSKEQIEKNANVLFVDEQIFEQTKAVLLTRCIPQNIHIEFGNKATFEPTDQHFAAIIQNPNAQGRVENQSYFVERMHQHGIKVGMATDLLALCLLESPGTWGADAAFGSSQRFGTPMGFGGPSAAFLATTDAYKRLIPGRIIGISKDKQGQKAYRLALQTREQHIKREKATSNICTSQALMAIMSGFYAVYHGHEGLVKIAQRVHGMAAYLSEAIQAYGFKQLNDQFFDTLHILLPEHIQIEAIKKEALDYDVNLRYINDNEIGISIDETTDLDDLDVLLDIFASAAGHFPSTPKMEEIDGICLLDDSILRKGAFLQQSIFKQYRTETELMRYIKKLERKDISLTHSMISLGSCTMKLNAAAEMLPLSMPEFMKLHPYAPQDQTEGFVELIESTKTLLSQITDLPGCSLQPNSGAAGEYAGLRVIREYLQQKGESNRNIVLIPASAHGTNPASAVQAGFTPITVQCDALGNVDLSDWKAKATMHADALAGCMITYPSTHGIFEESIQEMCAVIHDLGGQVYMDGANMNAQVGITSPGKIGADICHLNLHKTFAMPHGGGGPGAGPICCAKHLEAFLPGHPHLNQAQITVASAPDGSAFLLPISYGYIRMMGSEGLKKATLTAILSANYLAESLKSYYPVLYRGSNGFVGHEVILDCRDFKKTGITESDIAKRLMDYGFHAPTLSFPVHGTLMIEPTESESLSELNRFIEAMVQIYQEIQEIESGVYDLNDNVLTQSPHSESELTADEWNHAYTRQKAGYPLSWIKENKFQIPVSRVDNAFGDRNLFCSCQE